MNIYGRPLPSHLLLLPCAARALIRCESRRLGTSRMFSLIRQFQALGIEGSVDFPEVLASPPLPTAAHKDSRGQKPHTPNHKPSSLYPLACNLAAACSLSPNAALSARARARSHVS
jgi:hypothetical protein